VRLRDEHAQEVADRGGWVIWAYGPGDWVGGPLFADELDKRARDTVAALVTEECFTVARPFDPTACTPESCANKAAGCTPGEPWCSS